MNNHIYINDYSRISPIEDWADGNGNIKTYNGLPVGRICDRDVQDLSQFLSARPAYKKLDRSVQLALLAASRLGPVDAGCGINVGSSRGATGLWELYYDRFRESGIPKKLFPQTSPLTTLGNISSWVGQLLGTHGMAMSHSITCATASHAILNSIAWIESGMAACMVAGGSEAPLTDFTINQMQALRIYSQENGEYSCRALDLEKTRNQMLLGEGAALFKLSKTQNHAIARIIGYGTSIEKLHSATSVTAGGDGLQRSMRAAIAGIDMKSIDAIITHAPGTLKGDRAEVEAIRSVFGESYPKLMNNKWQIGHTLGASSAMSLAMILDLFSSEELENIPYLSNHFQNPRSDGRELRRVLINATGFGGNAVSLLVEKCN
ncbi:MAG: beta-ketoacyl synthase N-terminal-like domain-containing protein [Nonlabens sp.]